MILKIIKHGDTRFQKVCSAMSNLPYSSNQNSSSKLSKFDWPFLVKFYTFMFVSLIDVCEIYRTLFEPIGKR